MCRLNLKLDRNITYITTFLTYNEREDLREVLKSLDRKEGKWNTYIRCIYVFFQDGLWWQGNIAPKENLIVDARVLFQEDVNKVIFEKPSNVVYLDDINENFTKYNVGIKYANGIKNILVAKNEREFYLVDEHIHLDMMVCFNNIKDVVSENDEVFVFGTFFELLNWKAEK